MKKKIRIWTQYYNPFQMGGNVYAPIGCEVLAGPMAVSLGKGFYGYVVKAPNGETAIVEKRSGGIVGWSLADVKKDIQGGTRKAMQEQVRRAIKEAKNVHWMDADKFWSAFQPSKAKAEK